MHGFASSVVEELVIVALLAVVMVARQRGRRPFRSRSSWIMVLLMALVTYDAIKLDFSSTSTVMEILWVVSAAVGALVARARLRFVQVHWDNGVMTTATSPWGSVVWVLLLAAKLLLEGLSHSVHSSALNVLATDLLIMAAVSSIALRLMLVQVHRRGPQATG